MKDISESLLKINTVLHNKSRIGIMTLLMLNENITFNYLKDHLKLTDGNLNSHLKPLEKDGFIKVEKGFVNRVNDVVAKLVHRDFSEIINRQPGEGLACLHMSDHADGCGHGNGRRCWRCCGRRWSGRRGRR